MKSVVIAKLKHVAKTKFQALPRINRPENEEIDCSFEPLWALKVMFVC